MPIHPSSYITLLFLISKKDSLKDYTLLGILQKNPSAAEDKEVSACSRGRCAGRPPCPRPSIPPLMFPRKIQGLFPPLPFLFSDVVSVSSGSRFVKTFVGSSQQRRRGAGRWSVLWGGGRGPCRWLSCRGRRGGAYSSLTALWRSPFRDVPVPVAVMVLVCGRPHLLSDFL